MLFGGLPKQFRCIKCTQQPNGSLSVLVHNCLASLLAMFASLTGITYSYCSPLSPGFSPISEDFTLPEPTLIEEDEAEQELQKQLQKQRKLKQKQLLKDSEEKVCIL